MYTQKFEQTLHNFLGTLYFIVLAFTFSAMYNLVTEHYIEFKRILKSNIFNNIFYLHIFPVFISKLMTTTISLFKLFKFNFSRKFTTINY